jgi:hypothetical protein
MGARLSRTAIYDLSRSPKIDPGGHGPPYMIRKAGKTGVGSKKSEVISHVPDARFSCELDSFAERRHLNEKLRSPSGVPYLSI